MKRALFAMLMALAGSAALAASPPAVESTAAAPAATPAATPAAAPQATPAAPPGQSAPSPLPTTPPLSLSPAPLQLSTSMHKAPAVVVEEFHRALAEGFARGVLEQLAPDVVIYEQGFVERSREDYANGHLGDDLAFAATTKREVLKTDAWENGDTAWVITQAFTQGSFGETRIALENTETMVLKRRDGEWKIAHIHWSAHPQVTPESDTAKPAQPPPP